MKSKVKMTLVVFFLIWLAITVYFYFQHVVTIYEVEIDEFHKGIYIDKVYFLDVKRIDTGHYWIFDIPGSTNMKFKIMRLLNFYRDPFETLNGYSTLCTGFYDMTEPYLIESFEGADIKDLDIKCHLEINNRNLFFNSYGRHWNSNQNLILFNFEIDNVIQINSLDTVSVTLSFNDEKHQFMSKNIEEVKYNYFDPLHIGGIEMKFDEANEILKGYK